MAEQLGTDEACTINPETVEQWRDFLRRAGAVGDSLFGVQYDLNAAWRDVGGQMVGASWCNKNCTDELGNYVCDAAFTLNRGIRPKTVAPEKVVISALDKLTEGIEAARIAFFDGPFQTYCATFKVTAVVAEATKQALNKPGIEWNWFGGNPELNHGLPSINRAARAAGHTTTLTTTGGRMREPAFVAELMRDPPSQIALSADDFEGPEHIRRLVSLSFAELEAERAEVDPRHGQRQKAYEAVYAAKLAAKTKDFPSLLFNMVLHNGNLGQARAIIAALTESFPGVQINPFPAQSAFHYSKQPAINVEHAGELRDFIDYMIETQVAALRSGESTAPYAPRLHYWLMLRAVFDWAGDNTEQAMHMLAGNGIWRCYRNSAAGSYLQVGLGPRGHIRASDTEYPGEHGGCFWNHKTVSEDRQISDESYPAADVTQYIQVGKTALAATSKQPCPGCAFPRLTSHIIATESGMDERLIPFYLPRRYEALGY